MYYLYGLDYHEQNLKVLLKSTELKLSYDRFIQRNSVFESELLGIQPKIVNHSGLISYAPRFAESNADYFDKNPTGLDHKIINGYFDSALTHLSESQPELFRLVCFYMKVIVINVLAKYLEGTTDQYLGLSCLDFRDYYELNDFYELLFHQIVHKMTFIDNRLIPHLKPEFENTVLQTSFIHKAGGNNFSLYMAFHSFLVGVEVLAYRKETKTLNFEGNYHGNTSSIIRKTQSGALFLADYKDCFTSHGQEILSRAFDFLNTTLKGEDL